MFLLKVSSMIYPFSNRLAQFLKNIFFENWQKICQVNCYYLFIQKLPLLISCEDSNVQYCMNLTQNVCNVQYVHTCKYLCTYLMVHTNQKDAVSAKIKSHYHSIALALATFSPQKTIKNLFLQIQSWHFSVTNLFYVL